MTDDGYVTLRLSEAAAVGIYNALAHGETGLQTQDGFYTEDSTDEMRGELAYQLRTALEQAGFDLSPPGRPTQGLYYGEEPIELADPRQIGSVPEAPIEFVVFETDSTADKVTIPAGTTVTTGDQSAAFETRREVAVDGGDEVTVGVEPCSPDTPAASPDEVTYLPSPPAGVVGVRNPTPLSGGDA